MKEKIMNYPAEKLEGVVPGQVPERLVNGTEEGAAVDQPHRIKYKKLVH